jgi:hypothetical protein
MAQAIIVVLKTYQNPRIVIKSKSFDIADHADNGKMEQLKQTGSM